MVVCRSKMMSKSFESGRGEIFSDVDVVVIALSMKV